MTVTPKKIRQSGQGELHVEWVDGHIGRHLLTTLRDSCPCASCKGEREAGTLLPLLLPGKYEIKAINVVGSYAVQMTWGDAHQTGIYTYEYLRYLCECELCSKPTVHS
jgi:DUF971 family protein